MWGLKHHFTDSGSGIIASLASSGISYHRDSNQRDGRQKRGEIKKWALLFSCAGVIIEPSHSFNHSFDRFFCQGWIGYHASGLWRGITYFI